MSTLLFLLTILTLFVLLIKLMVKALGRKPVGPVSKAMGFIIAGYMALWLVLYFKSASITVPLGTDVCFDDWCATIIQAETGSDIQKLMPVLHADSTWIVLHVKMENHARGIAQKPSEPRIHLIDGNGHYWPCSVKGQQAFEKVVGKQISLDEKLELHQSLETRLVFAVPKGTKGLKALIEEGPFITKLLFPEDRMVFTVGNAF